MSPWVYVPEKKEFPWIEIGMSILAVLFGSGMALIVITFAWPYK